MPNKPKLKALLTGSAFFLIITSITFLVITQIFKEYFPIKITGNSMTPVIQNNQWVLTKSSFSTQRDHIYLIELPNHYKIAKYIIGIPQDTFYIKNNILHINNNTYPTNFPDTPPIKIPSGYYYCYGANQTESLDSKRC